MILQTPKTRKEFSLLLAVLLKWQRWSVPTREGEINDTLKIAAFSFCPTPSVAFTNLWGSSSENTQLKGDQTDQVPKNCPQISFQWLFWRSWYMVGNKRISKKKRIWNTGAIWKPAFLLNLSTGNNSEHWKYVDLQKMWPKCLVWNVLTAKEAH